MRTIQLEDLDSATQTLLRDAVEPTVIVEQGRVIAEIWGSKTPTQPARRFTKEHWDSIPVVKINVDSTDVISADRDR